MIIFLAGRRKIMIERTCMELVEIIYNYLHMGKDRIRFMRFLVRDGG
jgi:hypothetical protein